jgi:dTDP-4-amino-4,6-dideoxygalactose transaminase
MINVTRSYLPPLEEYTKYLQGIWERNWLTNYGPLVNELEGELKKFLGLKFLQFTSNGTIALQLAIKALGLKGEIITTPFSYVATTGAILWENCTPVFVDIEASSFCIDANKVEESITEKTTAILATHVYGLPCDVLAIDKIARKYNLKVIYDGAHAFGVKIKGESIFNYGDISTCSFHATKLFHTIEGGAIICRDQELDKKIFLLKTFGHIKDDHISTGINGKNSEFNAAMGLSILPKIGELISRRRDIAELYRKELGALSISFPDIPKHVDYNYAYFPVLFENENLLLKVKNFLADRNVNTRRYFFPSLNKLPYIASDYPCPVSEEISARILCLPFYPELTHDDILFICSLIKSLF